jgi:PAS domain S-box-containing protein
MSGILSMSIRTQLLLMALIVAVPSAGSILYSGLKFRQLSIADALQNSKKLGDSIAYEQRQLAASAEQLMSALAQLPAVKKHDAVETGKIFSDILKLNPQYVNISVCDTNGMVWGSGVDTVKLSMADRRYFRNAMATGRFSSGELVISRVTNRPTFNLCYPYRQGGRIAGAIIVGFCLDHLCSGKVGPDMAKYGYLVFDHSGKVLVNGGLNQKVHVGAQDKPEFFQTMQGPADEGTFVGVGFDGQKRFISYRKVRLKGEPTPYMYVRSGIPCAVVVAEANGILVHNLMLFASALAFAFLLAWMIGKRSIIDRVCILQDASRRLAKGDLQVRVSDRVRGGELGSLGEAFDEMADSLSAKDRERGASEAALRRSESHYRSIFDNSLIGIAVTGIDGNFSQVNRSFCKLLGYDEQELIEAKGFLEITYPEDLEESWEMYLKLNRRELEYYTLEKRYLTKGGEVITAICFVQGVYDNDGEYAGHSACVLDITELRASEELMRLFFERQVVGTAITSVEKNWLRTNETLQRMLGYGSEQLSRMTWAELTHPDDLGRDLIFFNRLLSGEIEEYAIEKRFLRKDGSHLHAALSVGCVRKPDGMGEYVLMVINDITEHKVAEEEILLLNLSLEQRVLERTSQLEEAIKEQESFSYSVSHDLRGPLRHINCYAAILDEEYGGDLKGEAKDYLQRIIGSSRKMGTLIDDLLNLSRIGRSELTREAVSLSEVAGDIACKLQEAEPKRRVEFLIEPDLMAHGDRVLLWQMLENLIGNAWKYSSPKENSRIELGKDLLAGQEVFFVKDNGVGFDMAHKGNLFGAFQRLHGSEFEGTGIGLATVKRIVERHEGSVWAEAVVDQGATIYFTLP